MLKLMKTTKQLLTKTDVCVRQISCTAMCGLDQRWREENGLPVNPNTDGPLAHLPDYTFRDGRPTPLGSNQKKRLMKQQEIAAKIVEFSSELNFAKERYARIQNAKSEEKRQAMSNKLKPKGPLLLKNKST